MLVLVFSCALASIAAGQNELPAPAKERNAALLYWQFYSLRNGMSLGSLELSDDPAWVPDEETSKALAESQDAIGALLRATSQKACDWGIEYERGLGTIMPHLGMSRAAARTLRADARRLAVAGDMGGATDRVVAIFKLSSHVCHRDARCMERSVAVAIAGVATNETAWLINRGGLAGEDGEQLFLALKELVGPPDPFGFVDGIRSDREKLANDLYLELGPSIEKKWSAKDGGDVEPDARRKAVHDVVNRTIRSMVAPVAKAMDEAGEAWTKDNAVDVLTAIWDRKEELGAASILMRKLQDSKNSELKVVARASEVMALFPETVRKKAEQEAREPGQKPPRF